MARKDSLLRLHKNLTAKRDALRKKLAAELNVAYSGSSGGTDLGDAACDGESSELNSQLAALESRELGQIERAIEMIRDGRYGVCEICDHSIPIARLKALPFTPLCVECQRRHEEMGSFGGDQDADWESAYELEGRMSERELTLGDIDID